MFHENPVLILSNNNNNNDESPNKMFVKINDLPKLQPSVSCIKGMWEVLV